MVDINIRVNQQGARVVQKDIQNIGSAALRSGSSVDLLRTSLQGLGAAFVIRGLVRAADSFTLISNRLRVATDDTAELTAVTEELLGVSRRTRTSFEANAELFQRFRAATDRLGVSQGELLRIVESINQAVTISGVTSVEAAQALRQLAQGIGSSELRGQELRSVLEQLPKVADIIAQRFNVTRGELLKLGQEGKIGAREVLEAFQNARPELARAFEEIVPTVGQALTVLRNQFLFFVGDVNRTTNVFTGLSRFILFVADNFETFGRIVEAVAITLGVTFAVRAVGRAIAAIKALNVALLSNPITAVALAITTVISLLVSFSDRIRVAADSTATLADVIAVAWDRIRGAIEVVVNFFVDNFGFIAELARRVFGDVELSVEGFARLVARVIDRQVGLWRGLFNVIKVLFVDNFVDLFRVPLNALLESLKVLLNRIIQSTKDFVDRLRAGLNLLIDAANRITGVVIPAVEQLGEFAGVDIPLIGRIGIEALKGVGREAQMAFLEGFEEGIGAEEAVSRFFDDVRARAAERAALAGEDVGGVLERPRGGGAESALRQRALDEILEGLEKEQQLLQLTSFEREVQNDLLKIEERLKKKNIALLDEEREALAEQLRTNQLLEEQAKILDDIVGTSEELGRKLAILESLYTAGRISVDQFNQAIRETQRALAEQEQTIGAGFERAFLDLTDSAVNFADITEDVLTSAFGAAEDAFVEFVKTGEFNFHRLVESILEDLARLAFRQAIFGLLAGLGAGGGFGAPGIPTAGQFLFGRQAGGPVTAGQPVVVGERRPELFVPNVSGRIEPIVPTQAPEVNVRIINATDPDEIVHGIASPEGEKTIINVVRRNRNAIRSVLGA